MSTSNERREIVPVPAFPSCDNCLHWGEDGIVVAAQHNVQFLAAGSNGWKVDSLRVNLFSETEWPLQKLSPISQLSVGEEQSESHVVAAQYSPSGVGIHRRAVLTVLTSNLLLSIWETDRSSQGWRRTCIINQFLEQSRHDRSATPFRIRAFEWLPTLAGTSTKWGDQFLVLVDDTDRLYCIQVSKNSQTTFGDWNIEVAANAAVLPVLESPRSTMLQKAVTVRSKVFEMSSSAWNLQEDSAQIILQCKRYNTEVIQQISMNVALPSQDLICSFTDIGVSTQRPVFPRFAHSPGEFADWSTQVEKVGAQYSKVYQLDGVYRIQYWGQTSSPDGRDTAICVTLHPWDRYEYGSAVHEKSYVLLRQTSLRHVNGSKKTTIDDILARVVSLTLEFLSMNNITNDADLNIVSVLVAWLSFNASRKGQQLATHIDARTEVCEICGSKILLPEDLSATCEMGHSFTRCDLTLLTIQEPGITKSCSDCKRHFLHVGKLGPLEDPSLVKHLSNAFDTCPYCGGKYSG